MSLINDMLNDLEQRRSQQSPAEVDLSWFVTGDRQPELFKKPQFWVIGILLSAVCASLVLHFLDPLPEAVDRHRAMDVEPARAAYIESRKTPLAPVDSKPVSVSQAGAGGSGEMRLDSRLPAATAPAMRAAPARALSSVSQGEPGVAVARAPTKPVSKPRPTVEARPLKKNLPLNDAQLDEKSFRNAQALIRQGEVVAAENMLRERLAKTPVAIRSAQLLASLLLSEERHSALLALYQGLLVRGVESFELRTVMGRSYLMIGQPDKAVELLSRSTPDVLENPVYHEVLALAAQRSRRFDLSAKTYQRLLQTDGGRADWWMGLAIGYDQRQNYNAASAGYQRALRLPELSASLEGYARQRLAEMGAGASTQSQEK